jgi:hypothetical protein
MILQSSPEAKIKKKRKRGGGAQSHRLAPESSASCRCSRTRVTTRRASRDVCGSRGMSSIGGMPKSMRTLATRASCLDRHFASMAQSSASHAHRDGAGHAPGPLLEPPRTPLSPSLAALGGLHPHPVTRKRLCFSRTGSSRHSLG